MSSTKDLIRASVSPFITGAEVDAVLDTIEEEGLRQDKVSLASYDQLFISTASGRYLDKRLSEVGLIRPEDIGLEDLVFRNLGIEITAVKQLPSLIHSVLETFYGPEAVRTFAQTTQPEPYQLAEGMQLLWEMDGKNITYEVTTADYPSGGLAQATADQVAAALTRTIRQAGSEGFAQVFVDTDTLQRYVQIITGVKGPTGYLKIKGGELENVLNFPSLIEYPAAEPLTWTTWVINRSGSTVRFSWLGNADPHLETVKEGDIALIYGDNFTGVGTYSTDLRGSFVITKAQTGNVWAPSFEEQASYFEIENPDARIGPGENITVSQGIHDALRFYRPKTFRAYLRPRYALAWEANNQSLRIYLPAVTKVVRRDLIGASHLRFGRTNEALIGNFGSNTDDDQRVIVVNEYSFKFRQEGLDISGFGGLATTSTGDHPIDYIKREQGFVVVVCTEPHGIVTLDSPIVPAFNSSNTYYKGNITEFGGSLWAALLDNPAPSISPPTNLNWGLYQDDSPKSDEIVTITGVPLVTDTETYPGPYTYDPQARYTLGSISGTLTQQLNAGSSYKLISVSNTVGIPDGPGFLMFDLNKDTQEEPVPIVGVVSNGILISPAYKFRFTHPIGSDYTYLTANHAVVSPYGDDYPFYATGTATGRIYCQELITQVTALGIKLEIIIIYPDGVGLGYGKLPTDGTDYRNNDLIEIYGE